MQFPSPCGVNIVANVELKAAMYVTWCVSVPLRGKYRGESCNTGRLSASRYSFRPLAG